MADKKVKRVVLNGETLIDLTADTVAEEYVVKGITFHGRDGGIYSGNYKPNIKALTITENGVYPVEDLVDGYGPITVEVTAGTVDPSMKPTLLPPTLTMNDSTETLTISDTRNDNHVQEYDLYFDGAYFMTVRHKSILLPAYATLSNTVAVQVVAKSESFNNSIRSNIVLWRYKEPAQPSAGSALYTPNIVVNGARKTLIVKSGDNNTAAYTEGYHIYCNDEKITSILFEERGTEIDISEWLDESIEQYFQAQAYRVEDQTQYARDSNLSAKKYVYYPNVGTEGLKYTLVSSTEDPYYTCDGIGTATETNIVIPSYYGDDNYPVREIKSQAFYNNTKITGVTFSNCLEKINASAFYQCSALTSVFFSDTIHLIDSSAFYNCSKIAGELIFPRDIATVNGGAFGNCSQVTVVDFSKRQGQINYQTAFYGTSKLTTLKMGNARLYYSGSDYSSGNYTKTFAAVTKVYFDSIEPLLKSYYGSYGNLGNPFSGYNNDYRNGLYYINNEPLTSLSVPDSITSINAGLFRGCKSVTTVDLNKVSSIGSYAFQDSSVTQVITSRELKIIENYAFYNCSSLRFFDYKDGLLTIGHYAFQNCTSLEFDSLPNSITSLGNSAFRSNSSLQEVSLPNSLTSINADAFYQCTNLRQINIPILISTLQGSVFYGCTKLEEILLPWGLKTVEANAFTDCSSLHTLTMEEGVTSLGNSVFSGCSSLVNINFSLRLTSLGDSCFKNCTSLTNIVLPEGISAIGASAFSGCTSLTEIAIPKNTITIGTSAFSGCTSLTEISIQKNVNTIGNDFLKGCYALEKIEVDPDNIRFYSENNVLYTHDRKTLIVAAKADISDKLELPEGVEVITSYAFEKAKFGEVIPKEGLKTIQSYAFSLAELTKFEFVPTITTIQTYAFSQCKNLLSAVLPDNLNSLATYAFYKCSSLKSAGVGKIIKTIPSYCYYDCQKLENFSFPPNATTIASYAFYNCKKLDNLAFPETLTTVSTYGLYCCGRQDYLSLPNLTTAGTYSFAYMKIGRMNLPSLKSYADYLFYHCTFDILDVGEIIPSALPNSCFRRTTIGVLYIRPNITTYGQYCFYEAKVDTMYLLGTKQTYNNNCWTSLSLNKIYIQNFANWLTSTTGEYFYNANEKYILDENLEEVFELTIASSSTWTSGKTRNLKHIKKLTLTNAYWAYGNNVFSGCNSLEELCYDSTSLTSTVDWAKSTTSSGTTSYSYLSTFKGMGDPEKGVILKIGPKVVGLPKWFINENDNFVKVDLSEATKLTTFAEYAFYGSKKLEEVVLGSSLTALPNYAIYNCQGLKKCDLPDNIKTLGNYAFANNYALPEIDLNQVTRIGTYCFSSCYSLNKIYYSRVMTTIPNYVFYGCYGLKEIEFFTEITSIGQYSFAYCYSLKRFTIPGTVTSIGSNAFYYCGGLQRITVGEKVTSIGSGAFQYCEKLFEVVNKSGLILTINSTGYGYVARYAKRILTSEEETLFQQQDGFEYYQDETQCILMCRLGTEADMILPNTLGGQEYVLSNYAFVSDNYLETFNLPAHIVTIPTYCFAYCRNLKEIVLPDSIAQIGANAFINSYSLEKIDYFMIAPSTSFNSVFTNAGKDSNNLVCIIHDGVRTLDGLFNSTVYVKELRFENIGSCTKFTNNAFSGLQAGIKVHLNELTPWFIIDFSNSSNNCPLRVDNSELYVNEELVTEIVVPESVKNISAYCFYGYDHLTYLDCGINTESIGSYAFSYNTYLNTVYIRNKVTSFGSQPFGSCQRLKYLHYYAEEVDTTTNLFDGYTANSSGGICEITIYGQVKKIPSDCFNASSYLTKVEFKENDNTVVFGSTPFNTSNSNFKVVIARIEDWMRFVFETENCNPIANLSTKLYVGDTLYTDFEPTEDIISIGDYAFYKYKHLQNIRLHKDFSEIGTYTFIAAPSIENIFVDEQNTSFVFDNCVLYSADKEKMYAVTNEAVQSFILSPTLKTIPKYSFYNRTSMEEIILPDSIEVIEPYAFYSCSNLQKSNLPKNLTSVGTYAFSSCTKMEHFTFSSISLTSIPSDGYTFYNMGSALASDKELTVYISKEVTKIPNNLFRAINSSYYARIKHLVFEEDSQCIEIGSHAFYYIMVLQELNLPEGVKNIGNHAFYYCSSLPEITLNRDLTTIGNYSFAYCSKAQKINFNESLTKIGQYAFTNCSKLTDLVFPSSLLTIDQYAFYTCGSLKNITIPGNVATIGQYAFNNSTAWYFCMPVSQPQGWNVNWNNNNSSRTVWGYTGKEYTYHFITNSEEVIESVTTNTHITLPSLVVEDKYFWGWYLTEDYSGTRRAAGATVYGSQLGEDNEFTFYARLEDEPLPDGSSFDKAAPIEEGVRTTVQLNGSTVTMRYFKFIPQQTKTYVYTSHHPNNTDTYGYLYDSNRNQLKTDDDSGGSYGHGNRQFRISWSATAGEVYYVSARFYTTTNSGSFPIQIV